MSIVERYGLREVVNVSGTMTAIVASSVPPEVVAACMAGADLQERSLVSWGTPEGAARG